MENDFRLRETGRLNHAEGKEEEERNQEARGREIESGLAGS